jgi:membrane-associated phospholipid phosphatase
MTSPVAGFRTSSRVPAAAVATLVSASRVEQRQHFMTDVAFGAAIGIASGRTVTVGHAAGRRITVAPAPVRRGMAVMATIGGHGP